MDKYVLKAEHFYVAQKVVFNILNYMPLLSKVALKVKWQQHTVWQSSTANGKVPATLSPKLE